MDVGGGASRTLSKTPPWAVQVVIILLIEKAFFWKTKRTNYKDEAIDMIMLELLVIGLISCTIAFGQNYILCWTIPDTWFEGLRHMRFSVFIVVVIRALTCGFKMALRIPEVNDPVDLSSKASFQLEIRAMRMTKFAPSLREAFRKEMSKLQHDE